MPDHASANFYVPRFDSPARCVLDWPAAIVHLPVDGLDDEYLAELQANHPESDVDEHHGVRCIAVVAGWWCAYHGDETARDEEALKRATDVDWVARIETPDRAFDPPDF